MTNNKPVKPIIRNEPVEYGEINAGDWRFVYGQEGKDCKVYFKGYEIRYIRSVMINATAGHLTTINIEFIPLRIKDMR